jgi:hypothetical protein
VTAAYSDHGLLRTAAAGDPPVPLAEEGIGPGRSDGSLSQGAGQVPVAVAACSSRCSPDPQQHPPFRPPGGHPVRARHADTMPLLVMFSKLDG